jgi:uncharacterized protein YceK
MRRASRIGATVVAVALAASSGCASAIVTPKQPVPYAGSETDMLVMAFSLGTPIGWPISLLAFADLLPSCLLDTLLLPVTISCASQSGEWELKTSLP